MRVNEDKLFKRYHTIRQTDHKTFQQFIDENDLEISVPNFSKKYRNWLLMNNLEYPYWDSRKYLDWFGKYYKVNEQSMEEARKELEMIEDLKILNGSPLVRAIVIFKRHNLEITEKDISRVAGVSTQSIYSANVKFNKIRGNPWES